MIKEEFIKEITGFFLSLIKGSKEAVESLIKLEANHKAEYKIFKEYIMEEKLESLVEDLDEELQKDMLFLLIKQERIMYKMARIYQLPLKEKENLKEDFDEFIEFMLSFLSRLSEKSQAKNGGKT